MDLYRAARDADVTHGTCFAVERCAAEAYLDNGGFGGPVLYRIQLTDMGTVLRIGATVREAIRAIAEVTGEEPHDPTGMVAAIVDQSRVLDALAAAGVDWVVYEDDYPEDCETWRVVSDAAMWAAGDAMTEVTE